MTPPTFYSYSWDRYRIHLPNNGGSHHFAAAKYIADQINKKIPINGKLKTYQLEADSIHSLLREFDLFAIVNHTRCVIENECKNFNAPVGFFDAPKPFNDQTIVFLSKTNKRAIQISKLFRQLDLYNFGNLLLMSLEIQKNHPS